VSIHQDALDQLGDVKMKTERAVRFKKHCNTFGEMKVLLANCAKETKNLEVVLNQCKSYMRLDL